MHRTTYVEHYYLNPKTTLRLIINLPPCGARTSSLINNNNNNKYDQYRQNVTISRPHLARSNSSLNVEHGHQCWW